MIQIKELTESLNKKYTLEKTSGYKGKKQLNESVVDQFNAAASEIEKAGDDLVDAAEEIQEDLDKDSIFYHMWAEQTEKYGDLVTEKLTGKTVSKSIEKGEQPGGLVYEANKLGIDMWDLLGALEGLCYLGRAVEIDDSTYFVGSYKDYLESIGEDLEEDYTLVGQDGNAFALMGYTSRCMKECGLRDEIDEMRERAMSGDYYNLIRVCDEYIQRCNEINPDLEEGISVSE